MSRYWASNRRFRNYRPVSYRRTPLQRLSVYAQLHEKLYSKRVCNWWNGIVSHPRSLGWCNSIGHYITSEWFAITMPLCLAPFPAVLRTWVTSCDLNNPSSALRQLVSVNTTRVHRPCRCHSRHLHCARGTSRRPVCTSASRALNL